MVFVLQEQNVELHQVGAINTNKLPITYVNGINVHICTQITLPKIPSVLRYNAINKSFILV